MADIWIQWLRCQEALPVLITTIVPTKMPQRAVWFAARAAARTRMAVCRARRALRLIVYEHEHRVASRLPRQNRGGAKRGSVQSDSRNLVSGAKRQSVKRTAFEWFSNAVFISNTGVSRSIIFRKRGIPLRGTFRFGK